MEGEDSSSDEYSDSDGPIQTLGFICQQPLPKQTPKLREPPLYSLPPYLIAFKEALDVYQANNPSQAHLPSLVFCYPGLVDHVYEQFQEAFSERLSRQASPNTQRLWAERERCGERHGERRGAKGQDCSLDSFDHLIGSLAVGVCNQLNNDKTIFSGRTRWPFRDDNRRMVYGSIMIKGEDRNLLVVELKRVNSLSIISEICDWARDGRYLDYDLYEAGPDVNLAHTLDSPQMTIQRHIARMISDDVKASVLMVAGVCCFAILLPFEDPSRGHFLALSEAYEFNSTIHPPILGTLVALLFDRYSGSDFNIRWPDIRPSLMQPKVQSPALCHLNDQTNVCNPSSSNYRLWLREESAAATPLRLFRIQPLLFPWEKVYHFWPEVPDACQTLHHADGNSGINDFILGARLGWGRSGCVYRLQNTSLIAKLAVYNGYEKCPEAAIEGTHIEAVLYETLLLPLQGRVVPRYHGFFSNHPSNFGNFRMLVMEDCGERLGTGPDFLPFSSEIRQHIFSLIDEIFDSGIDYQDVAPRNICVGPDGKTLRVIDFDGCYTFPAEPKQRAIAKLQAQIRCITELGLPDSYLTRALRSASTRTGDLSADKVEIKTSQVRSSKSDTSCEIGTLKGSACSFLSRKRRLTMSLSFEHKKVKQVPSL